MSIRLTSAENKIVQEAWRQARVAGYAADDAKRLYLRLLRAAKAAEATAAAQPDPQAEVWRESRRAAFAADDAGRALIVASRTAKAATDAAIAVHPEYAAATAAEVARIAAAQ